MTPSEELTPSTARFVTIEWEDIQSIEDWNDDTEINDTCSLVTRGWLIEDTPKKYVIAGTYDYTNEKWAMKFAISKMQPIVVNLVVEEDHGSGAPQMNFRHVPRPIDDEDRHAPNPNKIDRMWVQDLGIPGQP
jgi:hypothetical protein